MSVHSATGQTRRRFLKGGLLAGGLLASGRAASGAEPGRSPAGRRILFLTDIHARPDDRIRRELDRAADAVAATRPDIILSGGDHIHGGFGFPAGLGAGHWALVDDFFRRIEAGLDRKPTWIPMPGNHDLVGAAPADPAQRAGDPRQAVGRVLRQWGLPATDNPGGRLYYRRDLPAEKNRPATRILILDTVSVLADRSGYRGAIDPDQMTWIETGLSDWPADQPLIVLTHLPLLSTYSQVAESPTAGLGRNLVVTNGRQLDALLERFTRCRVLQGHLHVDETITWNDRTYRMGGAVCGAWWKGDNFGTPPGFLVLDQQPDGSLIDAYRTYA
ncbi:MAG: metallophosphoesterase family protein [Opitutales bacterium]